MFLKKKNKAHECVVLKTNSHKAILLQTYKFLVHFKFYISRKCEKGLCNKIKKILQLVSVNGKINK